MNQNFWRGKRVFMTGHTGFKGGWMSLWLQSMGAELTGYALNPPTNPSLFEVAHTAQGMTSIHGDIRNLEQLTRAMRDAKPEIIIHLAAQPLVRYSYLNPVETYSTNVMGTVHLLEAVRATGGIKVVVNITTDKCYENKEWLWGYRENDPMGGYDPYSNSKGCAELVTAAYRSSFFETKLYHVHGVALATVRAGNVIGGGDWAQDRLIPDVLAAFLSGKKANIRSPNAIRPWQHVMEPLRGYFMLAERLYEFGTDYAEAWNFGPKEEDAKSVGWIVDEIKKLWPGAEWICDERNHPHEANYLKLDISKVRSRLNWNPVLKIEDALRLTVDWVMKYKKGHDAREITLEQIDFYQKKVRNEFES